MWIIENQAAVEVESVTEADKLLAAGATIYSTLAMAVYQGGVVATPFDKPMREEHLYDTRTWFADGVMKPAGRQSTYKVIPRRSKQLPQRLLRFDPVGDNLPSRKGLILHE